MDSVNAPTEPKYGRGENPASLANLRPAWKPGQTGHPEGQTRPVITPALRRFAAMPLDELQEVAANPGKLTGAEAIALGMIIKAATEGRMGDKTREQVIERLDGINKFVFEVQVDNAIKLNWSDAPTELPQ